MSQYNTFTERGEMAAVFCRAKRVFFVGIGGIGMQGLALALCRRGYAVRGSDARESPALATLRAAGIEVTIGHSATAAEWADVLVYTLAIALDNPALAAARARGVPCFSRADLLGYLMSAYPRRVCVAGMHGKSTVTAMLAAILSEAGLSPTVFGGSAVSPTGEAVLLGKGEIALAEACEYKDSFLALAPTHALALNIEWEHPDYFRGEEQVAASFSRYLAGAEVAILPDCGLPASLALPPCPILRFGDSAGADARATDLCLTGQGSAFTYHAGGVARGRVTLPLLGLHNIKNALAALAACEALGVDLDAATRALSRFRGTARRLQRRGVCREIEIYEDYAHHPTEIRASLAALRTALPPSGRIFCFFEPHTYSRTAAFFSDFAAALSAADRLFLFDIYAAREKNESGISSRALAAAVSGARFCADYEMALSLLFSEARAGDLAVFMGAGDIHRIFSHPALCDLSCNSGRDMLK